ncbi:MAG: MaoC family dehydratase N-terminal domain-containing protein [Dehalococcoidia bacterium]|nr:MaoC family dehydratase N-terminal domain-containing protein [Dehalococcoidia bacterium]
MTQPSQEAQEEFIAPMTEGVINETTLEAFRRRVGSDLHISNIFNTQANKDAIRKFADGIGDTNPLWRDDEYAADTRYGAIVAPPNWYYSVYPTWVSQGLPGVHAFHSGNDWEFYKPIRLDDVIRPVATFTGFDVKDSKFAGKMVMEYQKAEFFNQKDELLAKTDLWLVRTERKAARDTGKYHHIELPHPWTDEELERVEEACVSEEPRGSKTRFWEDVEVGEEVPTVIKGPLGVTDMIAYCAGAAPVQLLAHGVGLRLYRRHPAWAFRDPNTNALEPIYGVHYNKAAAKAAGLPFPYDVGAQRHCWIIHLLTNWMGDDGWLKKNYAEYRKFVYLSDAVWISGKVTGKHIDDDGEHCVDIEHHAMNQRGEDTAPGHSTVVLPSRDKGVWPLDRRL